MRIKKRNCICIVGDTRVCSVGLEKWVVYFGFRKEDLGLY
jgi:hypothetical protein